MPLDETPARLALRGEIGGTAADRLLGLVARAFDPADETDLVDLAECVRKITLRRHEKVLKMLARYTEEPP